MRRTTNNMYIFLRYANGGDLKSKLISQEGKFFTED